MPNEKDGLQVLQCGPSTAPCKCECPKGPCDHRWDGPWIDLDADGRSSSVTCSRCGMDCMSHDMWLGE